MRPKQYNFSSHEFDFGIEEEFFLVDSCGNPAPVADRILKALPASLLSHKIVYYEFHKSQIEINTGICEDIDDARRDLEFLRGLVLDAAKDFGVTPVGIGTHPTADWKISELNPQYARNVVRRKQMEAYLTCGNHIHISLRAKDIVKVINAIRYYVPMVIPLAANSPLWIGKETGYQDYRLKVVEIAHTLDKRYAGLPPALKNLEQWNKLYQSKDIPMYWDIRPNFKYGTMEVRFLDQQPSITDIISLTTFVRLLTIGLTKRKIGIPYMKESELLKVRSDAIKKGMSANFRRKSLREHAKVLYQKVMELSDYYTSDKKIFRPIAKKMKKNLAEEQLSLWKVLGPKKLIKNFSRRFMK
ncbi:MAG: hypothetical protein DRO96_01315 [Candidatus Aenigmatarchaeota archaeon]|nr:MAG: hypothetical protein DRO96_01315 [Candidatus Aenigmarchaeota archaeon]